MKVILTEKITKLGNIGDTVEVKTGYARNYLLPNGKAMRFTRENVALFEAKKAELTARQEAAKNALLPAVLLYFGQWHVLIPLLVVALVIGEELVALPWMLATMVLGFVAYGLSIYYYTYAQRVIGAARTSAYYAIAPFIGVLLSMLILGERPGSTFFVALAIMLIGTYLASGKNEDGML